MDVKVILEENKTIFEKEIKEKTESGYEIKASNFICYNDIERDVKTALKNNITSTLELSKIKTNPYKILKTFIVDKKTLTLKLNNDFVDIKTTELPIADRYSTGSTISKINIDDVFEKTNLEQNDQVEITEEISEKKDIPLEQIDEKIMTIDDFLDDFKL